MNKSFDIPSTFIGFRHHIYIFRVNTTTVDIWIAMFRPTLNYSTWYLNYMGVDSGTIVSDVNI